MLNYSTKAIEDIQSVLSKAPSPSRVPGSHAAMREIVELLDKAVKIELPDNAFLVDPEKAVMLMEPEFLRLPFPLVALEYSYSDTSKLTDGKVVVPRRIALCFEYEAFRTSLFGRVASHSYPPISENGGLIIIPLFFYSGIFMPAVWGVLVPRTPLRSELSRLTFTGGRDNPPPFGFTAMPVLPEAAWASIDELGPEGARDTGLADDMEELLALVGLLAALSCTNVSLQDQRAPEKLNKKRLKSGKTPLYGFKKVVINVDKIQMTGRSSSEAMSGRKSPVAHLRRGHIRNRNNRRIWVQATLVGSGSEVQQKYQIVRGRAS